MGSVTRLLAESFAREYAVLSRQLEGIYQAGFLDTATGRDLEQQAALVGVVRRRRLSAGGSVVFSRTSPAPADIFIPAGTKLTTAQPPPSVFETTEDRTLQRGNLSVEAPVSAVLPGATGLVAANVISIINRPILGIDSLVNPQPTRFSGADETDALLRTRCRRALEGAGKATTGSLLAALTTLPGLREKDIRIAEDYLAHPGVVNLNVAFPEMTETELSSMREQAVALIDAVRPVGVRINHNIDAPRPLGPATPTTGAVAEDSTSGAPATVGVTATASDLFLPVDVEVQVTPMTLSLSADQRTQLVKRAEDTVTAFIAEAGIGDILIYNRLVARLMSLEGVLDVALRLYPQTAPGSSGRKNLVPDNPTVKPVKGIIDVKIGGALIMLNVAIAVTLKGAALAAPDPGAAKAAALVDFAEKMKTFIATLEGGTLSVDLLKNKLTGSDTYSVGDLHYHAEYVEAGVRIHQQDVQLPLTGLERLWVRNVALMNGGQP